MTYCIIIMMYRVDQWPIKSLIGRRLGTVCCWTTAVRSSAARNSSSSTWSEQASADRRRLHRREVQRPRPFYPLADVSRAGFRR